MGLYNAVSSPSNLPLHLLTNLFSLIQSRLLWRAFSHAAVTALRHSFIHLSELGHRGETKMSKVRNGSKGDSNPGPFD